MTEISGRRARAAPDRIRPRLTAWSRTLLGPPHALRSHLGSSALMSRDPTQRSQGETAHDVLAAEAFAVPTADPELRVGKLELPEDPSGIAEPHDILAAEEFAMPAAAPAGGSGAARSRPEARRRLAAIAAGGGLLALLRLRRRR